MVRITMDIDGMQCGMCEAHINEALRRAFPVKKVSSSHSKGETVLLLEEDPGDEALRRVIEPTGYRLQGIRREPYEKSGFFARFRH